MKHLFISFLKMFFRNQRAIFFVLGLPAGIFLILAIMRVEQVIQFDSGLNYSDFLLPGIMAYAVMQMGIYTTAYSFVDLRRQNVLKRLAVSPVSPVRFLLTHSLARFIMALIQVAALLALGTIFFDVHLANNVIILPAVIFVGCLTFLNFGYIISSLAPDYEAAAPYTAITGLTLGFLGDVFFPISNLPPLLAKLAAFLPLAPLSGLMRYALFDRGRADLFFQVGILVLWLIVGGLVAMKLFARRSYR